MAANRSRAREPHRRDGSRLFRLALTSAAIVVAIALSGALIALTRAFLIPNAIFFGGDHDAASVRKLQQVWNALINEYYLPVDENLMIEYAATAIPAALDDVYTEYLPKDVMRQFSERTSGHYAGIGVFVTETDSGRLRVTGMYEGSPAALAGVLAGDEIDAVDGADVSLIGNGDDVIERVRGDVGTNVSIRFYRPSTDELFETEMERGDVKVKNIRASIIRVADTDNGAKQADGSASPEDAADVDASSGVVSLDAITTINTPLEGRELSAETSIGYIALSMFDQDASSDVSAFVDKLILAGAKGLVIDLRDNAGGDFDESVKIADQLLGEGVIVTVDSRDSNETYSSDSNKIEIPYRILINKNSASASEVVSGAVKDCGAGVLIGEKTFGKGLVQRVLTLADGSGLKFTLASYSTPSGSNIHGVGIEPNIAVSLADEYENVPAAAVPFEKDTQLLAAIDSFSNDFSS